MQAQLLPNIPVYPLAFRLEAVSAIQLPEYAGAMFRGGFGKFFRELVCTMGAPVCMGCPELRACRYAQVFETPVDPERFPVLKGLPNAPHPFVMSPPVGAGRVVSSGSEFEVGVTLIGSGVEHLPHFIVVFDAMGRGGRFGGRFRVREAVAAHAPGHVVYDGRPRRMAAAPAAWRDGAAEAAVQRVRLEFVTPLRMRTGGRYNARPNFAEVAGALLRRLHFLAALYGGGEASTAWTHPLLAQADRVRTEEARFELYRWDRFSGRQGRRVAMDGVVGWLEASGELGGLMPALRLGEWVHVGSGTSMGMGRYRIVETRG
jgi:hypothetical protein